MPDTRTMTEAEYKAARWKIALGTYKFSDKPEETPPKPPDARTMTEEEYRAFRKSMHMGVMP